jgi:hypothetical protein
VVALLGTGLFFSYAHFKMADSVWESTDAVVTWGSGWFVGFWTLFGVVPDWDGLIFLNLFLFGLVLGLLVLRQRSLMGAIGFHAGIVTGILFYTDASTIYATTAEGGGLHWFWGSGGLRDGVLTTLAFGLTILVLAIPQKNKGTDS